MPRTAVPNSSIPVIVSQRSLHWARLVPYSSLQSPVSVGASLIALIAVAGNGSSVSGWARLNRLQYRAAMVCLLLIVCKIIAIYIVLSCYTVDKWCFSDYISTVPVGRDPDAVGIRYSAFTEVTLTSPCP